MYYGNCGFTWEELYRMPVRTRKFIWLSIIKRKEEAQKDAEEARERMKRK